MFYTWGKGIPPRCETMAFAQQNEAYTHVQLGILGDNSEENPMLYFMLRLDLLLLSNRRFLIGILEVTQSLIASSKHSLSYRRMQ